MHPIGKVMVGLAVFWAMVGFGCAKVFGQEITPGYWQGVIVKWVLPTKLTNGQPIPAGAYKYTEVSRRLCSQPQGPFYYHVAQYPADQIELILPEGDWCMFVVGVLADGTKSSQSPTITTSVVRVPEPVPFINDPSQFVGDMKKLQGTDWEIPDWWMRSLVTGNFKMRVRTFTSPDTLHAGLRNPDSPAMVWDFVVSWDKAKEYLAGQRELDPTVPVRPMTGCEHQFLWVDDPATRRKACAITWDITMQVRARVFADDKITKVGEVQKGQSCASEVYVGPVAGTPRQDWYRITALNGVVGLVKCQATDY